MMVIKATLQIPLILKKELRYNIMIGKAKELQKSKKKKNSRRMWKMQRRPEISKRPLMKKLIRRL